MVEHLPGTEETLSLNSSSAKARHSFLLICFEIVSG